MYIAPVSKAIATSEIGCHIGNMPCNVLLYADDLIIISPSYTAHQSLLNICSLKIAHINMSLNVKKSVSLIFSPLAACYRFFDIKCFPRFQLNNNCMEFVNSAKYLGHWLSTLENDNLDISNQIRSLFARTNYLFRRFSRCSIRVKISLFKSFCINFYGIALWNRYNIGIWKKLTSAYVKCIKIFFGYNKYDSVTEIFLTLKLPTLNTLLHNAKLKLAQNCRTHCNSLVQYVFNILHGMSEI